MDITQLRERAEENLNRTERRLELTRQVYHTVPDEILDVVAEMNGSIYLGINGVSFSVPLDIVKIEAIMLRLQELGWIYIGEFYNDWYAIRNFQFDLPDLAEERKNLWLDYCLNISANARDDGATCTVEEIEPQDIKRYRINCGMNV